MHQSRKVPQHSRIELVCEGRRVLFDSDFDSGNVARVENVLAPYHFSVWTASDCAGTLNEGYPKSWFYFAVEGIADRTATFSIHRLHMLYPMVSFGLMQLRAQKRYRPVYRREGGEWCRLPHNITGLVLTADDQLILTFDFEFPAETERIEFAYTYPYGYEQCQSDLQELSQRCEQHTDFYYSRLLLMRSPQGRNIDLVVVSSHEGRGQSQQIQDARVLPHGRPARFQPWKPVVLITARVHPMETPSSYCMKGMLDFLTNSTDARAYFLRKYFVFALVPMLNPDGVFLGHCRMDVFNRNLNRYYRDPDPIEQPSCYAVKQLATHYARDRRLFMYLDLHAHPANKGSFIFGNAINDFVLQVQSNLFPRLLGHNCINFEFGQCNFSRKHMKAKDRFQEMSKEGCGRVVFFKELGIIHSYTVECGYHSNTVQNKLREPADTNKMYRLRARWINNYSAKIYEKETAVKEVHEELEHVGYDPDELDNPNSEYYCRSVVFYDERTFMNLGRNMLVSILDVWNKNPYPRIQADDLRKEIAHSNRRVGRFRKEHANLKLKQKHIVQLINEQYYLKWYVRSVFNQPQPQYREKLLLMNVHTLSRRKVEESKEKEHSVKEKPDRLTTLQHLHNPVSHSQANFRVSLKKL